jgi:hypothetical protein
MLEKCDETGPHRTASGTDAKDNTMPYPITSPLIVALALEGCRSRPGNVDSLARKETRSHEPRGVWNMLMVHRGMY